MRVLLPVHIFLPENRAGVEQYAAQLAIALRSSVEVAVVTTRKIISRKTGTRQQAEVDGLTVFEVVNNLSHDSVEGTWSEPRLERAFEEILAEFKPDVVHFQHLMYWSVGLPALAQSAGAKVFFTLHDFWLMCARMGQLVDPQGTLCHLPSEEVCAPCMAATQFGQSPNAKKWIRRLTKIRSATGIALDEPMRLAKRVMDGAGGASEGTQEPTDLPAWQASYQERQRRFRELESSVDLFLTPSNSLRERFIEWGLSAGKIRHLAQGRDHSPFANGAPIESATGAARGVRLGFLGTVAPHKGVLELVRAFGRVEAAGASLTICGPHAQHPEYWNQIEALAAQDERIELVGPIPPSDVPARLRTFDLSCVPSLWDECCPLTIQEAFMAGTPVLASDLGGLAELVRPGVGGALAPPGDVDAWADKLIAFSNDPESLSALTATIPAVPNIKEHVDALLTLYRN